MGSAIAVSSCSAASQSVRSRRLAFDGLPEVDRLDVPFVPGWAVLYRSFEVSCHCSGGLHSSSIEQRTIGLSP
jgi:hypothetical protein